jgi:hypothetical protein
MSWRCPFLDGTPIGTVGGARRTDDSPAERLSASVVASNGKVVCNVLLHGACRATVDRRRRVTRNASAERQSTRSFRQCGEQDPAAVARRWNRPNAQHATRTRRRTLGKKVAIGTSFSRGCRSLAHPTIGESQSCGRE